MSNLLIFGLNGSKPYAEQVADHLDIKLSPNTEKYFDDDESYIKSDVNVRGKDVYVIAGLYSDAKQKINEKLVNLLLFIGSLNDASARRVTAVIPYMGYSRQDRKTESRAPITTKYIAQMFESVRLHRLLTIDVHSLSAFQNSFRIDAVDNLDTVRLFANYLCGVGDKCLDKPLRNGDDLVVLSPDIGGVPRSGVFQRALEQMLGQNIPLAVFDKRRVDGNVIGEHIIGDVKGKKVILFDDMIASGSTVAKSCAAVEREGGEVFAVCATHGLFTGEAEKNLSKIKRLLVTDSLPPWRLNLSAWKNRLSIVPTTTLISKAIRRTHEEGGSLSDLLKIS